MQAPPRQPPAMQAPPQRQPVTVMQPAQPAPQQPPQQVAVQPQQPAQQPPQQQGDRDNRNSRGDKDNQGRGEAQSLVNTLKLQSLPQVQGHLESARKQPGARLDFAGISRQIDSARSALAAAESSLSAGKSDAALQQAQAVQRQLADLDQQISAAAASSGGGSDDQRQAPGRQGDSPGNKR